MSASDGMIYAPQGRSNPVVGEGEFVVAAVTLKHGHINGMCNGLLEAGATLKWVWDRDAEKVAAFRERFPQARAARSLKEVLEDDEVHLVASADIPSQRCGLGLQVMDHGKDYFTDKAPMTDLEQVRAARKKVKSTGKKYAVYYSERLHVECAVYAGFLIEQGAIGRAIQVIGTGPHRLSPAARPDWFFRRETSGGILCDIGSHQIEQFLHFTANRDARILHSKVANYRYKEYPEFEDYGDCALVGDAQEKGDHRAHGNGGHLDSRVTPGWALSTAPSP